MSFWADILSDEGFLSIISGNEKRKNERKRYRGTAERKEVEFRGDLERGLSEAERADDGDDYLGGGEWDFVGGVIDDAKAAERGGDRGVW